MGREFRLAEQVAAAVALVVVFAIAISPITTYDLFWHLSAGRVQVDEGGILSREIFSHTRPGADWHNHSWLAASLFYVSYAVGGYTGVIVFKAVLVAAAALFLLLALRTKGVSDLVSAPVLVWGAMVALTRLQERPHIFTMLFLAVFFYLMTRYAAGRGRARSLWLVPVIGALWANLHSGAIFGLAVVGAFFAGAVLERVVRVRSVAACTCIWRDARVRNLGLACLGFVAAQGATPYGYGSLSWLLGYLEPRAGGIDFLRMNSEFMAPTLANSGAFFITLGLLLIALAFGWRKLGAAELILVLPFALSALSYRRMLGEFAIVMVPVLAGGVMGSLRSRRLRVAFAAVAGSAVLAYTVQIKALEPDGVHRFAVGVEERLLPVGTADFIDDLGFEGNIYNDDGFGGYLAWKLYPKIRIYFDGRGFVFASLYDELRSPRFIERYGITAAVVPPGDEHVQRLFPDAQWASVYWDACSVFLVRRDLVTPTMRTARLERFVQDLKRSPDDADLLFAVGQQLFEQGDASAAAPYLERVVAFGKHLPPAHTTLGYIAYDAAKWTVAEEHFRAAIAADPALDSPWYGLGLSLESQARSGEAAAAYVKYLSLSRDERWRAAAQQRLDALKR